MECPTTLPMFSNHSMDILLKLDNDRKTTAKYCDITLIVDNHISVCWICCFLFMIKCSVLK